MKASLEIKNITKTYGSGHTRVRAVNDVSLTVKNGEIILIMGPSGSGKTTLITMAGALLKPSGGTVLLNGHDISQLSEIKLPKIRLKELGFVFQSFNLLASLSAVENVAVPLMAARIKRKVALAKAQAALEKLGLKHRLDNLPRNLSGGEKQRVSVARAIVNNPSLIFADEPTANLDSKNGHEVMKLLCRIACEEHRTVVIVSHDQRLREMAMRVLWMEDGQITREEVGGHQSWCTMPHHTNHS